MRKHGWQLPYHPLQVVAVAVFLALGFAFYVFFAPFLGKKSFQYIIMGIYTPLIVGVFGLYIWCAAADPADAGVFRSKKYLKIPDNEKPVNARILGGESPSSIQCVNTAPAGEGMNNESKHKIPSTAGCNSEEEKRYPSSLKESCFMAMLPLVPCAYACSSHEKSSNQRSSEDCFCLCLPVIQWFVTLSSSVYCFQILKLLYLLEGFATPLS